MLKIRCIYCSKLVLKRTDNKADSKYPLYILADMNTELIKIDRQNPDYSLLIRPAAIISKGGLVAFPTETVYGLGGDALNPESARKIYLAKGRPSDNPLIVHIADMAALKMVAADIPERAVFLAEEFWPGPMTLIFKKKVSVPNETSGGLDTVAVRMPDDDIALNLIRFSGNAIAAPSANSSGRPSPTLAQHVLEDLGGKVDLIIDGGAAQIGLESTIIDISTKDTVILRPGAISLAEVKKIVPQAYMDKALANQEVLKPKAPGMKYRHYAPRAAMLIVEGSREGVARKINEFVKEAIIRKKIPGIMILKENLEFYTEEVKKRACIITVGSKKEKGSVARNLFKALRQFDQAGVEIIYSEAFYEEAIGEAVMNRLLKAASYQVLKVD